MTGTVDAVGLLDVVAIIVVVVALGVFVNEWITRRPPPMP